MTVTSPLSAAGTSGEDPTPQKTRSSPKTPSRIGHGFLNRAKPRVPGLCHHKATGQGFVVIDGRFIYLGRYGAAETQQKYHQLIAEYLAAGGRLPVQAEEMTVTELLARFWEHAIKYYRRPDGSTTGEVDNFKPVIAVMRALYGHTHVSAFGPLALRAVRQKLIERGLSRTTINQLVNRGRRIFRWGVSEQLVPATVLHGLQAVQGLKFGRSDAPETDPVRPVESPRVHAIEPFVSRQVWALIQLQLLTGARSGELVIMRPDDIDRTDKIWVFRPRQHKTRHHGHERLIYLGPRAQEVLRPFLLRAGNAYCFSPQEAEAEHRSVRHAQRQTPMSCGNTPGSNRKEDPQRAAGGHYTPKTYHRAIQRGCDATFLLPEALLRDDAEVEAWRESFMSDAKRKPKLSDMPPEIRERHERIETFRAANRWHPHQLRHAAATNLRKEFGLETARIILGHRRQYVAPLLKGKAKAMVVVSSRQEAVRWKLAIDKYIKSRSYGIGTLVAFSGEVDDPESAPEPVAETSTLLNPNLRGRDIRDAFGGDEYQILLVANKFQTGFDQPLLCGMYVDKRLDGIQAVQTLSRLNRAYPGKDTTYVLDFVNDAADVLTSFKTYYETAELADTTNPDLVLNLRSKLDAAGHYDENEIDRVVKVEMNPHATQSELVAALEPVADRLMKSFKAAQEKLKAARSARDKDAEKSADDEMKALLLFRSDMGAYHRLYTFLSQIFDYANTAIEKRDIFYKRLIPLLDFGREREGIDLSKVVLTHHTLKSKGKQPMTLGGEAEKLQPLTEAGAGQVQEKQKALLDEIIRKVNDLFEGELTDQDKLVYVNNVIKGKLLESPTLQQQAANNTKEQFGNSPDLKTELLNAIMGALDAHTSMSTQALNSPNIQAGIKDILLNHAGLWESLRSKAAG